MLSRTRRASDSCSPGVSERLGEEEEDSTLTRFFEALTDIFTDVTLDETKKGAREAAIGSLRSRSFGEWRN